MQPPAASPRTLLSPKWVLSHLFVIAMVVAMVSLGLWQLRRLDERRADNDAIRAVTGEAAVTIEELLAAAPGSPDGPEAEGPQEGDDGQAAAEDSTRETADHTPVTVSGTYASELSFLVANRTFDSRPGYWLATPVRLADGRLVVVARGWVPRAWVSGDDQRVVPTPQEVQLAGRAFETVGGGRVGSSIGDLAVVSRLDIGVVRQALGADVVDIWVQLEQQAPRAGELPIPVPRRVLDDGPHLSYAFQWLFFSAGTVVVYALILLRRLRAHPGGAGPPPTGPDQREPGRPVAP